MATRRFFFFSYFILNSTIRIYTRNSGAAGSYERGVRSGACCCSSSSPCCLLARAAHAQLHALVDMSSLVPFLLLLLCMTCCVGALCGGGWVEVSGPAGGGATGGGVHLRRMWSSLCLHFRLARDGAQEGCFWFWGGGRGGHGVHIKTRMRPPPSPRVTPAGTKNK